MITSDSAASRIATSGERQGTGQPGGNQNPGADPPTLQIWPTVPTQDAEKLILMGHAGLRGWPVACQEANDATVAGGGGGAMRDDLDHRLHDAVALDEIDLYADVLSAVAAADRPLTDDELDAVLGLGRTQEAGPPAQAV